MFPALFVALTVVELVTDTDCLKSTAFGSACQAQCLPHCRFLCDLLDHATRCVFDHCICQLQSFMGLHAMHTVLDTC